MNSGDRACSHINFVYTMPESAFENAVTASAAVVAEGAIKPSVLTRDVEREPASEDGRTEPVIERRPETEPARRPETEPETPV